MSLSIRSVLIFRHPSIPTHALSSIRLSTLSSHISPSPLPLSLPYFSARSMATGVPQTMKGVLIEQMGGIDVLQYRDDLPVPAPKEGEILVKNEYIGINYIGELHTHFFRYSRIDQTTLTWQLIRHVRLPISPTEFFRHPKVSTS